MGGSIVSNNTAQRGDGGAVWVRSTLDQLLVGVGAEHMYACRHGGGRMYACMQVVIVVVM